MFVTQPGLERPAEYAARDAVLAGATRILVLGGDGSSSQALNGIYAAGGADALTRVSLGLLPAGTGRDYARSAGIHVIRLLQRERSRVVLRRVVWMLV